MWNLAWEFDSVAWLRLESRQLVFGAARGGVGKLLFGLSGVLTIVVVVSGKLRLGLGLPWFIVILPWREAARRADSTTT